MSENIKLSTSLVDLDNITPKVSISNFSMDEIESMANLIIRVGGVIRPVILKKIGFESWEVVAGDFEYYASVKALEIDPDFSETIRAFTIKEEQEENIRKQQEILRILDAPIAENLKVPIDIQGSQKELNSQAENNTTIQKQLEVLNNSILNLTKELNSQAENNTTTQKQIEALFNKVDRLEVLPNKVDRLSNKVEEIQKQISSNVQTAPQPVPTKKLNLKEATKTEIEEKLSDLGVNHKQITATWNAIQKWKTSNKELTWGNLEQLAKSKDKKLKVLGFGKTTYDKLRKIAEIPK